MAHDSDRAVVNARGNPRLFRSLSASGVLVGSLFFAASLGPSLVPRPFSVQGILSGCAFAAGYAIAVFLSWLWFWLGLRAPRPGIARVVKAVSTVACVLIAAVVLWRASAWQDDVRALMGLGPVERTRPLEVAAIALLVFGIWIGLARIVEQLIHRVSTRLPSRTPRRLSRLIATVVAGVLIWSLVEGVLFRAAMRVLDSTFAEVDARDEVGEDRPVALAEAGIEFSDDEWHRLGRTGRNFVADVSLKSTLGGYFGGEEVEQPIRVYVGLNSAETVSERAELALAQLVRTGGFERSVLVIATPTGTGWVDPGAIATLEYLHRGDVATVAMQYSYLPSYVSLLVEPGYGVEAARALFSTVYGHWTRLPKETRPKLYLHGVSLGALNSDLSADLWDVIADPLHGALWTGPPFTSPTWKQATAEREPRSPYWLPKFRDGSIIRFVNQTTPPAHGGAEWGPTRIVYLQYASDAVTFFDPRSAFRKPPWLVGERGPDVSPRLRWFPVVTLLHLTVDLITANNTPPGFGHTYVPRDYIDAWVAVTDPKGWTAQDVARLKARFAAEHRP